MALSYILKRWKPAIGLGMIALMFGFTFWCSIQSAQAQQNASQELDVLRLRPNFYVIAGAGGNIAVETGPEGTIVVNAGTAEAAGRVVAAIKKVTDQPIRYIIDTSADRDFVEGNAVLAKAGRNIMAAGPEPIRRRVSARLLRNDRLHRADPDPNERLEWPEGAVSVRGMAARHIPGRPQGLLHEPRGHPNLSRAASAQRQR